MTLICNYSVLPGARSHKLRLTTFVLCHWTARYCFIFAVFTPYSYSGTQEVPGACG